MSLYSRFAVVIAAACLGTLVPQAAQAQSYPQRPIRLIVPFPPGGGVDVPARLIAAKLAEALEQQWVVDNRSGANAIVGTNMAAKATPDGYTLLMVPGGHAINPALYSKLPYDTVKDFASVSLIANGAYIMATNNALPVKSVSDFIGLAKTKPGQLNYGSGGVGNLNHLAAELFSMMAGVKLVHIPYKGGGPMLTDLIGGHISLLFTPAGTIGTHVRANKVHALAVTTATRSPAFPSLPTVAEAGVAGYVVSGWYAMLAPAKTPSAVISRLSGEIAKAVATEDVKDKLVNVLALDPVGSRPAELDALIRAEITKWQRVVKTLGISPES